MLYCGSCPCNSRRRADGSFRGENEEKAIPVLLLAACRHFGLELHVAEHGVYNNLFELHEGPGTSWEGSSLTREDMLARPPSIVRLAPDARLLSGSVR